MARRRRLLQQAADETLLRYGPEERGLARLLRESRANLKLGIRAERATSQGVKAATRAAKPLIQRSYANAGSTFEQADQDIKTLSPGASSAAAVREAAGARRRMAESLADAESELTQRSVDAESGEAYGIRQRRREYQGERAKIGEEQRALRAEEGRYASTTFRQLTEAEAKRALEARRIRVSIGNLRARRRHDTVTEGQGQQRIDETRRHNKQLEQDDGGKGKPRFTPLQRRDARAMWDKAKVYAETLVHSDDPEVKAGGEKAWVQGLVRKGIPPAIARAAIQFVRVGGVKPRQRRRLRRDYGLKPKVRRVYRSKPGDRVPPVLEPLLGRG